ncbi:diguanylate cyclase [Aureimonas psammosilenae]|uniref:diguanylate cyclase n=1 Tax=Aureimonas psammosilenae TaxID=2495496 RepID=UPI001AEF197E|nr:diguanylate cyclase [Aureimonas psammosilenae]
MGGGLLNRISMRGRMTVLIGSALAPLALFLGVSVVSDYDTTLFAARRELLQTANLAAAREEQVFATSRVVLDVVRRALSIEHLDAAKCHEMLAEIKGANPQFLSIGLSDPDGTIACHSTMTEKVRLRDLDFIARVLDPANGEMMVGPYTVMRALNRPTMMVAMPMSDNLGRHAAMVFAALDLDYLSSRAESLSEGGRRTVSLVDATSGRVLNHYPPLDDAAGDLFQTHPLMEAIRRAPSGGVTEAPGFGGLESIFGFQPIGGANGNALIVVIGESRNALLAPIQARSIRSLVGGSLTLIIALLAAWLLGYKLKVEPVLRLTRVARRIGSGDFMARGKLEPWHAPELRDLSETLDRLALRLAEGRTAEQAVAASEERYRLLANNIADLVTCVDNDGIRTFASPSSREVLGWEPEELLGQHPRELIHPDEHDMVRAVFESMKTGASIHDVHFRMRHKDGHYIWVGANGRQSETKRFFVFTLRDVTARKQMEEEVARANRQLASLASTDGLTGLLNRRAFDATLEQAFAAAIANGLDLCVLMIDVDRFKGFNDQYGHLAGDDALRRVAKELRSVLKRPGIAVARYGGEEFAVIMPEARLSDALGEAEELRQAVRRLAIDHAASEFGVVTLSIGVSSLTASSGIRDMAEFMRRADRALYRAKNNGRDRTEFGFGEISVAS